jgi:alpha-D-ribose 1-methylphosphonate 5-triphosphate synthase subunit PhnG
MVMLVHRDGVETSPFNMGEVLVTRAEADFNGILGFGCVVGDEPERAWCAAVIDAWLESHPDPAHPAAGVLEKEALRYLARRQEEDRMVGATKVRFDVKP